MASLRQGSLRQTPFDRHPSTGFLRQTPFDRHPSTSILRQASFDRLKVTAPLRNDVNREIVLTSIILTRPKKSLQVNR